LRGHRKIVAILRICNKTNGHEPISNVARVGDWREKWAQNTSQGFCTAKAFGITATSKKP
jgi:hypothetical protein